MQKHLSPPSPEAHHSWKTYSDTCPYRFPDARLLNPEMGDLISVGADLEPSTLLYAYSHSLFPMHIDIPTEKVLGESERALGWFSPAERAIIPLDHLRITRSMNKSAQKYECRIDTCFEDMMRLCMTVPRHSGWIDEEFIEAYVKLHELGFAHSVEVFHSNELVGGLYGVGFAHFFAGESMVHIARDASKVALIALVAKLKEIGTTLLDAQWMTPHLQSLGAVSVSRNHYYDLLQESLTGESKSWS